MMNRIRIYILFHFAFPCIINFELREMHFSEIDNKENNLSLTVFYQEVATVPACGVQCPNDECCALIIYDRISRQCFGVNFMENVIYFYMYQKVLPLSDKTELYRKGNI